MNYLGRYFMKNDRKLVAPGLLFNVFFPPKITTLIPLSNAPNNKVHYS